MNEFDRVDVAIVGGGIAGLVAASYAARAGRTVALFERSRRLGGRAQTTTCDGLSLNLGAHALYTGGANAAILDDLGIQLSGGKPDSSRYRALRRGRVHILPTSAVTLASTRLLGMRAKLELGRALASLSGVDASALDHTSLRDWIDRTFSHTPAREAFGAITRVATYSNDPERASAGATIRQLQLGTAGVRYLDGGWHVMVEALRERATEAGARIESGRPIRRVIIEGGEAMGVQGDGGRVTGAHAVVIATPPSEAARLTALPALESWSAAAVPIRAAALDVALARLPNPRMVFSLGIDRATYFSVHSRWARLAPHGQQVVHLMKYLAPGDNDAARDRRELEELLDILQPGWREAVVHSRFLPGLAVAGWLPAAATGGLAGRPGPTVPGARNLFVAGDWVGAEGMLSDAAFASGKFAGALAAAATTARLVTA